MNFADLGLHDDLTGTLAALGYEEPTPIQAAAIPPLVAGRDLLGQAATGTGKTAAFALPLLERLHRAGTDPTVRGDRPRALVLTPTRELAMQVSEAVHRYGRAQGARVVPVYGGQPIGRQLGALQRGVDIVVATPGRAVDHIARGSLDLGVIEMVVLDEADEMLDMGFREDLEEILDSSPVDRRTLLFSATIAKDIAALAKRYQKNALRIDTVRRDEPHGDIEYRAIRVAPNEVELAVVNVLRFYESPGALVFCNTREGVRHMHAALRERGFAVVGLSGELGQRERSEALQALRDGHARVCVATDVAARGLDLPDLGLVIHADIPINKPGLLHRSGRTGRAGKKGISVLLVSYTRRRKAEQLLASAGIEAIWQGPPTADEIRAKDQVRLLEDPILTAPMAEEDLALAKLVLENRSAEEVAAALIRLHRQRLPSPEELYDDARMRDSQNRDRDRPVRGGDRYDPADRDGGPVGRPPRLAPEDVSWFRISVGRDKNADPKWLIPMICRLGHVTKKDIGSIKIFDRETKFEISKEAEPKFAAAVKATVADEIKIEPSSPPGGPTSPPRGGANRKGPPSGDRPFRKGPPGEGKPAFRKGPPGEDRPPFRKGPPRDGAKPAFKGPPGAPGPKAGKPPWKKKGNDERR